jgi:perosamine synthetase
MIPITKTVFDETDLALIQKPLRSGWVVQGKYVKQFEEMFSKFIHTPYSIATTSCTTSLHIAMASLGLRPGDEVLVPAFTWVATANCVEYMGAKPVFVDIDLETFNIDLNKIEEKITPKTKGIIPVHLFGLLCPMDKINKIAEKYNLFVVEDAACAFDSWYKGKHAGTWGDMGCFSFHPRKAITTGEGGMITTDKQAYADMCQSLRDHGATKTDFQRHEQKYSFLLAQYPYLGYNYRMTDIQGALGVSQMQKAKKIMDGRRRGASEYNDRLKNISWLKLPYINKDYIHGYQSYVCLFQPEKPSLKNVEKLNQIRNDIMASLEEKGIITRQGTHAAALVDYYRNKYGIESHHYPNAYLAESLTITLPLYYGITSDEIDTVIKEISNSFDKRYKH